MSIHILGQNHDVAVFKTNTGRTCRYWTERGVICCEDDRPPLQGSSYVEIPITSAEQYIANITVMIGMSTKQGVEVDQKERASLIKFVNQMGILIRKAKEHGDPHEQFRKTIAEAAAKLPKKLTVSVPQKYFD